MSESSSAFGLLHERVQRWIWEQRWTELRDVQERAVGPILSGRRDVILSSGTASGKTEAAFLPICSRIVDTRARGIQALCISPLKALINDQYERLSELCDGLGVAVNRWHGDVPSSAKQGTLRDPRGILLITPESLEALFVTRGRQLARLFDPLDRVVVDELHAFIGTERGRQTQSLLHRLERTIGRRVQRIGLSATLGDMAVAADFLRPGHSDGVEVVSAGAGGLEIHVQTRGYWEQPDDGKVTLRQEAEEGPVEHERAIARHLYETLRGSDNLVFANARRTVEAYADLLRGVSEEARVPNEFVPHHGSLAKDLREDAEERLKDPARPTTAICTSTLELGIDVGRVASIGQIQVPFSVASLRQRLGRSGRRGEPAVLRMYVTAVRAAPTRSLADSVHSDLVQAVAMVDLLADRWCEPAVDGALHLSTLVQQVLSVVAQHSGARAKEAWEILCSGGPFKSVSSERFLDTLRCMGEAKLLEQAPDGTLLLGEKGEAVVNHFSFYSVFQTPEEFTLVHGHQTLGRLALDTSLVPGGLLVFAGRRWRVLSVEQRDLVIVVEPAPGGRVPRFLGARGGLVHDEVRQRMRRVWEGTEVPRHLDATARDVLREGRSAYADLGLQHTRLVADGRDALAFLCRGDRIMNTVAVQLARVGLVVGVEGPWLRVHGSGVEHVSHIMEELVRGGPSDPEALARTVANKVSEKYDAVLNEELRSAEYASRALDTEGAHEALGSPRPAHQGTSSPRPVRAEAARRSVASSREGASGGPRKGPRVGSISPTDLARYFDNPYVAWMEQLYRAYPDRVTPDEPNDQLDLVAARGLEHERAFLEDLRRGGRDVVDVGQGAPEVRRERTLVALQEGREVVYQGSLGAAGMSGYPDFLVRVDRPSSLGAHAYEPWDTKLALQPKPYFLVQLCAYADMLEEIQGVRPEEVVVVLGQKEHRRFRTSDFFFYYLQLKEAFLEQQESFDADSRPDPLPAGRNGRWETETARWLEAHDHLLRVADVRRDQIERLRSAGIKTMAALAGVGERRVRRMRDATLLRLRDQARLQLASQGSERPLYEVIPPEPADPRRGLATLPPPCPGDVVFDIEGYPFATGGLEYLLGVVHRDGGELRFRDWWALDEAAERRSFEAFVDWVHERWREYPSMHVFHYAAYEPTAMRRLMGKHGTREDQVDDLLRHEVFVDLYRVVHQGVRAGVQRYSLKHIEKLYSDRRVADVKTAGESIVLFHRWLTDPDGPSPATSTLLREIRAYNEEDCRSTWALVEWLRTLQARAGIDWVAPPTPNERSEPEETDSAELARRLLGGRSATDADDGEAARVRPLLAHLLEFHRREAKPTWWRMFARREMTEQELWDDLDCLAGLRRTDQPLRAVRRSQVAEYRYDRDQDTKVRKGSACRFSHDLTRCRVEGMDAERGLIEIAVGSRALDGADEGSRAFPNHLHVIPADDVSAKPIEESIRRTVRQYLDTGGMPPALRDVLCRSRPRLSGRPKGVVAPGAAPVEQEVLEAVLAMDETALCIQGPPGTGKTWVGARVILELIKRGKRVGVTTNSHKAILNLMAKVADFAEEAGFPLRAVKIGGEPEEVDALGSALSHARSLRDVEDEFELYGATAWPFSSPEAVGLFDYLFVDEAGQVALANLVGVAPSSRNLVLLGDQMQLGQPFQGSHPGESGQSALDYLLQGRPTIPGDLGIFLGTTWRLHPRICRLLSDAVYEGRLEAHESTSRRSIRLAPGGIQRGEGLVFVPVAHAGNTQGSDEEAVVVRALVNQLLRSHRLDASGRDPAPIEAKDILIVAPYNLQVRKLKAAVGSAIRVGTIDKFQGQEALVVIVSMAASAGDVSSRGVEFLLDKNRLNVAVSRAQALAVIVGNPHLARTGCTSVATMSILNLFARIVHEGESGT